MQKFFITGASGWLGRKLIEYVLDRVNGFNILPENISIFCLPNEDIKFLQQAGVNIFFGDIRDVEAINFFLQKATDAVVIHLCGVIHPKIYSADFFDINFLGTKHVIEISNRVGVKKIVVMSSNSPIGCNKSSQDEDVFTEDSAFNPYMKYGKSKFLMEKFVQNFIAKNKNLKVTIIRAPWFYGPYQPVRQTTFFKMIRDGKFPIIGDGNNKRSMVYTENVAQGIMLAALSDKADNQVYWIADDEIYSMSEIIKTVKDVMEKEFGINCRSGGLKLPAIISDVAWLADCLLQKIGFYQQKIHVLSEMNKNIFCSVKKAQNELGYKPKFNLYSGTKESVAWCISQNFLK